MKRLGRKIKSEYHINESLPIIKRDWRGNRMVGGRFSNLRHNSNHGMLNILKWRFSINPDWKEKLKERWRPKVERVLSLDLIKGDAFFWMGHNSFYIQLGGKRVLVDPVFYNIPFVRRRSELSARPVLFRNIDYILLSHDHYDHLDKRSLKDLLRRNPKVTVLCGLNMERLIKRWHRRIKVVEMGWYQSYGGDDLKITFLPCQHWGKRSATDSARRLWGAFMLQSSNYNLYYSGDTGYAEHFKELPSLFGRIDCAMIGIGAYKPRWFMRSNHISPYEALDAAHVMGAELTVPMHYGTFSLSDEPMSDPPRVFRKEADNRNMNVIIPDLGEIVKLKRDSKDE